MLRSISIENFRALREFRMSGLGRVNLLVGTNNCGKTSVLEAIHILAAVGQPDALVEALVRRGEIPAVGETDIEIGHLFRGHRATEGVGFRIASANDQAESSVVASIQSREVGKPSFRELRNNGLSPHVHFFGPGDRVSELGFRLEWHQGQRQVAIDVPVTHESDVPLRGVGFARDEGQNEAVRFIRTGGLSQDEVVQLFDATVLTPDEAVLLEALHAIEPTVERIASITGRHVDDRGRGGMVMMVAGQRVPAGSMGDGVGRLLGIALALVRAKGGILLVDEIDTGLHYTVLTKMWRLVLDTATRLDVQVFATTHSLDCYEALGEVAEPGRDDVSLQRIERGRAEAIAYTAGMLRKAAEHGIEVR